MSECLIRRCTRAVRARGLCDAHYAKHWANGTIEQFPRVTRPAEEWYRDWQASGLSQLQFALAVGVDPVRVRGAIHRHRKANGIPPTYGRREA